MQFSVTTKVIFSSRLPDRALYWEKGKRALFCQRREGWQMAILPLLMPVFIAGWRQESDPSLNAYMGEAEL